MSEAAQSMDRVGRLSPATTTGVMVAGVIICFVLFVVVFFLYLRSNRYWGAIPVSGGGRTRLASAATEPRGLDAAAVAALPPHVVVRAGGLKEGLECPVCLSVLSEGEAARLLPQCGHAFHLECIDMWFCSHSTCPVCRSPAVLVEPENTDSCAELAPGNAQSAEFLPNTPANVLLRASESQASNEESGSQEESSSSASGSPPGVLVIEIPRRPVDGLQTPNSPLPASRLPEEAMSPPTTTTLRSLRRLLILGSRIAGASRNPRGRDVEQGRAPASKAQTSS